MPRTPSFPFGSPGPIGRILDHPGVVRAYPSFWSGGVGTPHDQQEQVRWTRVNPSCFYMSFRERVRPQIEPLRNHLVARTGFENGHTTLPFDLSLHVSGTDLRIPTEGEEETKPSWGDWGVSLCEKNHHQTQQHPVQIIGWTILFQGGSINHPNWGYIQSECGTRPFDVQDPPRTLRRRCDGDAA